MILKTVPPVPSIALALASSSSPPLQKAHRVARNAWHVAQRARPNGAPRKLPWKGENMERLARKMHSLKLTCQLLNFWPSPKEIFVSLKLPPPPKIGVLLVFQPSTFRCELLVSGRVFAEKNLALTILHFRFWLDWDQDDVVVSRGTWDTWRCYNIGVSRANDLYELFGTFEIPRDHPAIPDIHSRCPKKRPPRSRWYKELGRT